MAINEKEFNENLCRTVAWTNKLSQNFDYENGFYGLVFRQTNPFINGKFLYNIDSDYTTWNIDNFNLSNYSKALAEVSAKREDALDLYFDELSKLGRILRFEIGLTTHDGAMIVDSQCFFDESDAPPIDTWFYLEKLEHVNILSNLYCWIPKPFESVVEQGMRCDFMKCCSWFRY